MNEDKLKELEYEIKRADCYHKELDIEEEVLDLIAYVRQLEKEKVELTRKGESLCNQNGALLIEQHDLRVAKTELLSALGSIELTAKNKLRQVLVPHKITLKRIKDVAQEAITKHSTEGGNDEQMG